MPRASACRMGMRIMMMVRMGRRRRIASRWIRCNGRLVLVVVSLMGIIIFIWEVRMMIEMEARRSVMRVGGRIVVVLLVITRRMLNEGVWRCRRRHILIITSGPLGGRR